VSDQSKMEDYNPQCRSILLYCSQPLQTQDDSEAEVSLDFPLIREQNSTPPAPPAYAHSHLPRRHAVPTSSKQLPLSSEEEEPQFRGRRQPDVGLGQSNVLNVVDTLAPVGPVKMTPYTRCR
jgi:hypothetical protein